MSPTHLAAFSLSLLLVTQAVAGTPLPGVRFDLMPVGCKIHGVYSSGKKIVDEYIGVSGQSYVITTYADNSAKTPIRNTSYDASGYMTRKDWAGGKWESFAPFSCFDVPGQCSYLFRNASGVSKTFRGQVRRVQGQIISTGGFIGQAPFPQATLTPGPFNVDAAFSDGKTSFHVTRYEACGKVASKS